MSNDPMRPMAVSPDAQWLAFSTSDGAHTFTLNVMPVSGGNARELLRVRQAVDLWSTARVPDGRQLFFVKRYVSENRAELWRIAVEGGEPQNLEVAVNTISQIGIHPDGRRIAYNYGKPKSEIRVMENFLPSRKPER